MHLYRINNTMLCVSFDNLTIIYRQHFLTSKMFSLTMQHGLLMKYTLTRCTCGHYSECSLCEFREIGEFSLITSLEVQDVLFQVMQCKCMCCITIYFRRLWRWHFLVIFRNSLFLCGRLRFWLLVFLHKITYIMYAFLSVL